MQSLSLIVSAFRTAVNPWRQAQDTKDLLADVQREGLLGQLVIGRYDGVNEISVHISGFVNEAYLYEIAAKFRARHSQETVLVLSCGKAYLQGFNSTEYIGDVVMGVSAPPTDNYTMFMDGRVMTVELMK